MVTDFLKLILTDKTETEMTFEEWRTIINGNTDTSNMALIDKAFQLMYDKIYIHNDDENKTYAASIHVIDGKPVMNYEEVL